MINFLIPAALILWGIYALRSIRKGKTGGCSGDCSKCSGCK